MSKLHKIKVKSVQPETPDCVSITFDIPETLKDQFQYKPGQHIIVRKEIDGEDMRRTYSFCAAPSDDEYKIAVRLIEGGAFSIFANNELKAGDELEISAPLGEFSIGIDEGRAANYVAFAAGSGITPVMAMIREVLAREPYSHFFLYYGNRDAAHTIFAEELAQLKNIYMGRFSYQFFMTRQAVDIEFFNGRITGEKAAQLYERVFAPLGVHSYYLCGPFTMVKDVRAALMDAGAPSAKIHSELFFASPEIAAEAGARESAPEGVAKSKIQVISDGRKVSVDYRDEHGSILEAALKSGIDVSFACKGGVCATCRAKVIEGDVDMALQYGVQGRRVRHLPR